MISELKNSSREIIEIIDLIDKSEPEVKKILTNHLLIQVYTVYERLVKITIKEKFDIAYQNYYMKPLLLDVKIKNATWTPNLNKENIVNYFPILKEWLFWNLSEYKYTSSMVNARHQYAHQGKHTATEELILSSFLEIIQYIYFLDYFYKNKGITEDLLELTNKYNEIHNECKEYYRVCTRKIESDNLKLTMNQRKGYNLLVKQIRKLSIRNGSNSERYKLLVGCSEIEIINLKTATIHEYHSFFEKIVLEVEAKFKIGTNASFSRNKIELQNEINNHLVIMEHLFD